MKVNTPAVSVGEGARGMAYVMAYQCDICRTLVSTFDAAGKIAGYRTLDGEWESCPVRAANTHICVACKAGLRRLWGCS